MNWSDYEGVWKRLPPPIGADADLRMLRETFAGTHRKMAATLQVRDISEGLAGVIGALFFGFIWWRQGAGGWPIAFAIILILRVSGVYLGERLRSQRQQTRHDATMLDKVKRDLEILRRQQELFRKMGQWYLAPLFIAMVIVVLTISFNRPPWDPLRSPWFLLGLLIFNALIFWFVWIINRRAVRRQVEPRMAELEKLQQSLVVEN